MDKTENLLSDSVSDSCFSNISLPECSSDQDTLNDRALSPVLNRSTFKRKSSNRRKHKSKVKLLDKFTQDANSNQNLSLQIENELNTSFDLSAVERIEKIQQLEETKKRLVSPLYNVFAGHTRQQTSEHEFKKPTSPAPIRKRISQISPRSSNRNQELVKRDVGCILQMDFANMQDFQTGSGKAIEIAPDKLRNQKGFFGDILKFDELSEKPSDDLVLKTNQSNENKFLDITQTSMSDTQLNLATDIALTFDMEPCSSLEYCKGFAGISFENNLCIQYNEIIECFKNKYFPTEKILSKKRKIAISNENLTKQFKSDGILDKDELDTRSSEIAKLESINSENIQLDDRKLEPDKQENVNMFKDKVTFTSFTTAGGSSIKISDDALIKANAMLDEENLSSLSKKFSENPKIKPSFVNPPGSGFATAGGSAIKISNEGLKKANAMLDEENLSSLSKKFPENPKIKPSFVNPPGSGFATAGGSAIKISNEALKKANAMLDEENLSSLSKKFAENPKIKPSFVNPPGSGFATAGGSAIKISNEALKKANAILDEENLSSLSKKFAENPKIKPSFVNPPGSGFATAGGSAIKISNEALKKANAMLDEENLSSLSKKFPENPKIKPSFVNPPGSGFSTAGGSAIKISNEALKKANTMLDEENLSSLSKKFPESPKIKPSFVNPPGSGFATAGGSAIKISNEALKKANAMLDEENLSSLSKKFPENPKIKPSFVNPPGSGFSTAGGSAIKISNEALKKANTMLDEENLSSLSKKFPESPKIKPSFVNPPGSGFATAGGSAIKISNEALKKANAMLDEENLSSLSKKFPENPKIKPSFVNPSGGGFATAGGSSIKISNEALKKANAMLEEENLPILSNNLPNNINNSLSNSPNSGFATVEGNGSLISSRALEKAHNILMESNLSLNKFCSKQLTQNNTNESSEDFNMFNLSSNTADQFNDTFNVEIDKFNNAPENSLSQTLKAASTSSINKQFVSPLRDFKRTTPGQSKKTLGVSISKQISISKQNLLKAIQLFDEPVKDLKTSVPNIIYSSTPVKDNTGLRPSNATRQNTNPVALFADASITPIKHYKIEEALPQYQLISELDSKIVIKKDNTKQTVESQLEILYARTQALESQKHMLKSGNLVHNSAMPGVLSRKKRSSSKMTWKDFFGNEKPSSISVSEAIESNISVPITTITPSNAEFMNFNCNVGESESVVQTQDGATIVPNLSNLIGVREISNAFQVMPGVDPKLIPRDWIDNHFKWIVWKLASLERNFPNKFANYLSVETVVQQLKYRYDREIDNAERPALRRILEKDDTPLKRLILCVADIIESCEDTYELELTDGWYSIRTAIDTALTRQIQNNNIVVGTKLITQYAELLNCDGCHPLQVSDTVRLKITYNCTRRALWHSKLGYQKIAAPFPIYLKTILPEGGLVGCIKVYIARVYPIKYIEKDASGRTTWRNKKAEDRRAEQWEQARLKQVEMVQHKIQKQFEAENENFQTNKSFTGNIAEINSPRILYQMLENTNDPEGLQSMLSPAQLKSAMNYKLNISVQRQQELSSRISEELKTLKLTPRIVTPVLTLRVTDALDLQQPKVGYVFNIYKPAEDLLQSVVESSTFSVFNVIPKHNRELTSNSRTHFLLEGKSVANNLVQRNPVSISNISTLEKPTFNEYDTFGTVVQLNKNEQNQAMWLTDCRGSLLLVKIIGGPGRCSLLDNISRGKSVGVLNLTFTCYKKDVAQAIANLSTVITSYPQQSLLQEKFTEYCKGLPKDPTPFLEECDTKINCYLLTKSETASTSNSITSNQSTNNISYLFDDCDDTTIIPSRLTTTDIAMSLIDTDQYFENF